LVHALKFRSHLAAADVMAAQMAVALPRGRTMDAALVPVPFAPERRSRRGFDPADALATRLSQRTGRPVVRCLRRAVDAPRQLGASRAARLRAGGIVAEGRAPPIALLVDDVHTTGGTLDTCARALATVGTREVLAVTYARTVRRA
jgi:predicted amidophosphoribosyltransferase